MSDSEGNRYLQKGLKKYAYDGKNDPKTKVDQEMSNRHLREGLALDTKHRDEHKQRMTSNSDKDVVGFNKKHFDHHDKNIKKATSILQKRGERVS